MQIFRENDKLYGAASLIMNAPAEQLIDCHVAGREPQLLTLNLTRSITPIAPTGLVPDFEVVGVLQLGGGGSPYECEIDMVMGMQISLLASRVVFAAQARALPPYISLPTAAIASVMASIGLGTVAHGGRPQRTISDNVALVPLDTRGYLIPAFAQEVQIYAEPIPTSLVVDLISVSTQKHGSVAMTVFPGQRIPLAADTRVINIRNTSGANIDSLRLIFGLAL